MTAALEGGKWSAAHPGRTLSPGKTILPILQETGWASEPVWKGGKLRPHRDSIPDRPARSSVAIPTELPGPHFCKIYSRNIYKNVLECNVRCLRTYVLETLTEVGPFLRIFRFVRYKASYCVCVCVFIYVCHLHTHTHHTHICMQAISVCLYIWV